MKHGMMLAAMLMLAGCGGRQQAAPREDNQAIDVSAAADAIRAEEAQWNRDYAARDVEAIVGRHAADATQMGPGAAPTSGIDAIRAGVTRMVADPAFRLEFASDHVAVAASGDLGYSRGRFTLTTTDAQTGAPASATATMQGSYLTVWRRQPDGRWKVIEDFITPGPTGP